MDIPTTTLSHGNSNRRKLTKKPPSSHSHSSSISADGRVDARSLTSKRSSHSLRRAPSAPAPAPPARSLSSNTSNSSSPRFPTAPTSSSSRSHPSPVLPGTEFATTGSFLSRPQSQSQPQPQYSQPPPPSLVNPPSSTSSSATAVAIHTNYPLSSKTSDELIGAPFDGTAILSRIEATKSPAQPLHHPPPPPRPAPPPPLHTTSDARSMGPPPLLQQSSSSPKAELPVMNEKPHTIRLESASASKRNSDESKESKIPGMLRKKSGFSGFMNSLVGSPKKPLISAPENPVHVTHVGYDSTTGQFTVRSPSVCLPRRRESLTDWSIGAAQGMAATHQREWHHRKGHQRTPTNSSRCIDILQRDDREGLRGPAIRKVP